MYDDLLGPRKPKEEAPKEEAPTDDSKIRLKTKKFNLKEDPWKGAGKDLSNEEEETELELDIEDYGDLDEEIEKALKDFGDDDEDENELPDFEDVCDGCSDDDCDNCTIPDDDDEFQGYEEKGKI